MPLATVNGVQLYWEETGRGSPVIMVHEFAGDGRSWEPQVRCLSRSYRVITYNHRGYPPSSVPQEAGEYSQDILVGDLAELLRHLQLGAVFLCGCSMGANIARDFAIAYPYSVRGLVLVGAGAGSTNRAAFLQAQEIMAKAMDASGIQSLVDGLANVPTRASFKRKDPRGFAEFLRYVGEHDARACAHLAREVIVKRKTIFELEDALRSLIVPTLIVAGDRDEPCVEASTQLRSWLPHAGLALLPDCGHTPNLEEPSQFNGLLTSFLASVEAGRWAGWRAARQ
jgi:pimeloyl-ACP methyl ester carboxylesterase